MEHGQVVQSMNTARSQLMGLEQAHQDSLHFGGTDENSALEVIQNLDGMDGIMDS